MKKVMALALALAMLASCALAWNWPWASKGGNTLSLSGSTTVLPISQKAAEVYMKNNPSADITVRGGGSGVGIAAIIDGSVDIADASRAMSSSEIAKAKSKGVNPVGTVIARDGITIVVNPANSLKEITLAQLKDIYTGKITKWSQLGGSDDPIVIVSRDSSSGTFEVFNEKVLGGARLSENSLMQASNQEVAETVGKTPGAVGYVGLAYVGQLKAIPVDGVSASIATVLSGEYKISRPLYMYTNGEPSGAAKEFIDFILSDDGQKIVSDVGYIALNAK